jgi:hypothetical protein
VQPFEDLVEVVMAGKNLAQDERCPAFGENLGRAGDRAELTVGRHPAIVDRLSGRSNFEFRSGN